MLSIGFFAGKTVKVLVQIDDQVLSWAGLRLIFAH
jgi:hypothetical protein